MGIRSDGFSFCWDFVLLGFSSDGLSFWRVFVLMGLIRLEFTVEGTHKRGSLCRGWTDDIVSWCKTGLQELNSLAQDRRRWQLITRQAWFTQKKKKCALVTKNQKCWATEESVPNDQAKLLLITTQEVVWLLTGSESKMIFNDLERPLRTLLHLTCVLGSTAQTGMKIDTYHQRQKCTPWTLVSGNTDGVDSHYSRTS